MKKTLLLLLTLMMMGGVNVYATRVYADLSKLSNGPTSTWDGSTNTMTWSATSNNMISNFDFPAGNYSAYTKLVLNLSDLTGASYIRVQVRANGRDSGAIHLDGNGTFEKSLTTDFGFTEKDLESLEWIRVLGSQSITEAYASVKINYVYLEKPFQFTFDGAGKAVIDPSDMVVSGGLSLDPATGVLTSDGSAGELKVTFPEPVDLSALTRFEVNRSGEDGIIWRVNFKKTDGTYVHNTDAWYASKFGLSFNEEQAARATDVTEIIMESQAGHAADVLTITNFTIISSVINADDGSERRIETLQRKYYYNGTWETGTVNYAYGNDITNIVGDGSANQDEYIDLSGYKELRVYASKGNVRLFVIKQSSIDTSDEGYVITTGGVRQNGYWGGTQDTDHKLAKNGDYFYIAVADIEAACNGQAKLIAVKAEYGETADVSKVVVTTDAQVNYILSGKGAFSASATAALADASATVIDATGVTGTGVTLTSANPNCIFVANEGTLANTQNVCVNGTIGNLVLTDGYPYETPDLGGASVTATSATYSRTMPNKFGTLILPFRFGTASNTAKFYSISGIQGDMLVLNEYTNTNESPSRPYIIEAVAGAGAELTFNNSGVGDQYKSLGGTGSAILGDITFRGVLKQLVIDDVALDTEKDYYYIANNQFMHATGKLTVNPFRSYIEVAKSTAGAPARLGLKFSDEEETTAIQALTSEENVVEGIYNAGGVPQQNLQKGLNIVKLQNGKSVKVLVK